MARGPVFVSNLSGSLAFVRRLGRNSLHAAAVVVRNRAKRNVRGGFKSGDFVTGNIINKVEHRVDMQRGVAEIGTTVDYGAFWELGHHNAFTRRYERVEWLKPAFKQTARQQQKAAHKAASRT